MTESETQLRVNSAQLNWKVRNIIFIPKEGLKMNKNLDKLKQFFRSNKTNNAHERVYVLNSEIERELRKDSSNEKRVKLLRDLGDIVISNRLEEVFDALII